MSIPGWLTGSWEANWRTFRYFIGYRLLLALLCLLALLFPGEWNPRLGLEPTPLRFGLIGVYLLGVLSGLWMARFRQQHFNLQLSLQTLLDSLTVSVFMYFAGGVTSGLGLVLLVLLAAASLVGQGRLVLFYAAVATMAALMAQSYGVLRGTFDPNSIVQAGFLSAGYFAIAILARLLGQRIMLNEDLARRRGIALDNQMRINQRVVERMQDGVVIVNPIGALVRFNPRAGQWLQLSDEGVSVHQLWPALAEALDAWRYGRGKNELSLTGPNGQEFALRFEPTTTASGEVLVFMEDMARIEAQARQLKLAALGRLTASIAHEIRNPLTAISHAGELMREEARGAMEKRLLRIILDNSARLDRIVTDVLDLGRQRETVREALDLSLFLPQFVQEWQAAESLGDGVLVLDVEAQPILSFDRGHLHRVVWNLLSNARRYASGRVGSLRMLARSGPQAGSVVLRISDDGPGVPEALQEQIFEPFFTTHTQGTGLGLFIVRELCAANGASLTLLPGEGGACFEVVGQAEGS